MTFFQVENLSIAFGGLEALIDVDFQVQKGIISQVRHCAAVERVDVESLA